MRIEPELVLARPTTALIVVVLPAPLGPRKPKNSPAPTRSEMPSTAVKVPYRLTRFSISMAGPGNATE